ncbi:CPBP family intramembrane glutamic endopeptidase [Terricaulis sp.]|uniref:CPBP family intramembrane glutamic endopeptidase n=1 Tax=Terricaulis sp. TaxID=2768686 RepID=UPI0037831CD2
MTFTSPIIYLAVFAPSVAALICARWQGAHALRDLLSRLLRWRINPIWLAAAILLPLCLGVAPRWLAAAASGEPPPLASLLAPAGLAGLAAATLADPGPLGEELGWRGFALPRLLQRMNGVQAALLLGAIWALWHVPAFFIAGMPQSQIPFIPWLVCTLALSVLMAWVTNGAQGALAPAMLMHWGWNRFADLHGTAGWLTAALMLVAAIALCVATQFDLDRRHNPAPPATVARSKRPIPSVTS